MTGKYAERLAFAARKATGRQEFLASFLDEYQRQEALSDADLLGFLGCTVEGYYQLALCLAPDLQADDFGKRIERIGRSVGVSVPNLARAIRQVAAVRSLGKVAQAGQTAPSNIEQPRATERPEMGWARRPSDAVLLAARDREDGKIPEEDTAVSDDHTSDKG